MRAVNYLVKFGIYRWSHLLQLNTFGLQVELKWHLEKINDETKWRNRHIYPLINICSSIQT